MKKIYSIAILLMFLTSVVNAATRTASVSGNWNSIATWGGASVPVAADDVIINPGITVTVTAAAVCNSLTTTGGTLSLTAGNLTISSSGTVTINTGGAIIFNAANVINGGGGGPNGVLVNINSGSSLTTANASGFVAGGGGSINVTPGGAGGPNYNTGANYTFNAAGAQVTGSGITGAANLTFAGSGNKTLSVATLITGTLSMQGTAVLITTSPTYGAAAILEYAGSAAQTTSTVEFPAAMSADVIINNAAGVTLDAAKTLSGNLTLTNGLLTTTSTNLLTIAAGFSTSGASDISFVNGPLAKAGTTAFTFPVGKFGAGLHTIGIGTPTTSSTFTAEFFRADPHTIGTAKGTGITQISACEYWVLNRTAGTGDATVTLSWTASSPCSAASYVTDLSTLRVARWTGALWEDRTNAGTTGNTLAGTITSNLVTAFGPFTLASSASTSNPLPLKFGNITGYEKQSGIQIDWTAYSESNLSRYEIERSADGKTFNTVGQVAALNATTEAKYGWFDAAPLAGINFYRLRNVDLDSKFGYSSIIKVNLDKTNKAITVYPNPVTGGYVSFQSADLARGNYSVKVFNAGGQQVYSQRFTHNGGAISQTIQLPGGTRSGMYSIQLDKDDVKVMSKTFMVQ